MTDERTDARIGHTVGQGVNFCFYLLGKAQLRLPALARPVVWARADADPFADFAHRFDVAPLDDVEPIYLEPLWRPWLQAVAQTCPNSAADALSVMPDLAARPHVRNRFQRFGRMALNEFIERWTGIELDLEGRLTQALRAFDGRRILARHEAALGLEFRAARATFAYHLLRVSAVTRFGPACIVGALRLDRPWSLADVVARGTLHALIAQTEVWERDDLRPFMQALGKTLRIGALTPAAAAEEALCTLVEVVEHEGEAAPFEHVERRITPPALRLLARAFYDNRRVHRANGFLPWIRAGLEQATRMRVATSAG